MVICNTTICIDTLVAADWVDWMKKTYIPLLKQTGKFRDVRVMRICNNQDEGGVSFALMMMCDTKEQFSIFEQQFSRSLDDLHNTRYKGRFASFQTMLEEV